MQSGTEALLGWSEKKGGDRMLLFSFVDYFAYYMPVAAAVILVALSLAAFAYAIGSLLMNEQLKTWARMEATEVFYSVMILAFATVLFALANDSIAALLNSYNITPHIARAQPVCEDLAGTPGYSNLPCHIALAKSFFADVFDQGSLYLYSILRQYSRFTYFFTLSVSYESVVREMGGLSFSPFAYLQVPLALYSYVFDFGVRSLILLKLQEVLMEFISTSIFPLFFTLGVALRAFPAMRKLGGLLMAAAVSFYYVYPAFFVLGAVVFNGMMDADVWADGARNGDGMVMDAPMINFTPLNMPMEDPDLWNERNAIPPEKRIVIGHEHNICRPAAENPQGFSATDEIWEFLKLIWNMLTLRIPVWGDTFGEWIFGSDGILNGVARMVFFSLFFSFLAIMSTIGAIKTFSPLLGGDIEIAGLTHLV